MQTLRDRFIAGMARAATTVNVVTTDGPAGRAGVTVSAMSSVSADAPLLFFPQPAIAASTPTRTSPLRIVISPFLLRLGTVDRSGPRPLPAVRPDSVTNLGRACL